MKHIFIVCCFIMIANFSEAESLCLELFAKQDQLSGSLVANLKRILYRQGKDLTPSEVSMRNLREFAQKATDVDSFLDQVPATLFLNSTIIYNSKSSQFGSPKSPRVLVSNADSSLVLTYSGNPNERGYESIEVVEFDFKRGQFIPYEITFSRNRKAKIERDPMRCKRCHGSVFRPIWESYPFWPGVFGGAFTKESADTPKKRQFYRAESELLKTFMQSDKNSRYRFLPSTSSIESLHEVNNGLTYNFAWLRAQQIREKIHEVLRTRPDLAGILMWISRELGQVANSEVGDLWPMLSPNDRLIFDREFSKIENSVHNQFMKSRQRKLFQHFNPMSVAVNPTYAFKGRDIPIADLDLGVLFHRYATNEENERNLQASIIKFAYLQFVWVHLLGRDLRELNLSLDVNDLPTLTTPGINAWGYVY